MVLRVLLSLILSLMIQILPVSVSADHKLMTLEDGVQIPQPDWFKDSFLDLSDDLREAADENRRVVLYFHQTGCPYCYNLITQVFADPAVNKQMQSRYDLIALDLWGDRIITLPDGREISEKELAVQLRVQYTPTLIFLQPDGTPQLRMDGYRPAELFLKQLAALDQPAPKHNVVVGPYTLSIPTGRPVAIQFISANCEHCREFEVDILGRSDTQQFLDQYNYLPIELAENPRIILPNGKEITAQEWAAQIGLSYSPAWLLLDDSGVEQLRIDAYVRAFHFNSALEYVLRRAYLREPEFQRFINTRGDRFRAKGLKLEILE